MKYLRPFWKRETGATSIEFVILFPVFMSIFLSTVEAGMLMIRSVLLERGVDLAVRELRLGISPAEDEDSLKIEICNHASFLRSCTTTMRVELTRLDTTVWDFPSANTTCFERDEDIQPALEFENGADHQLMLLRACANYSPMFPWVGLGMRMVGGEGGVYSLVSTSAFVVEPA